MSLKDRINDDMKAAMRARDTDRLGAIRLLNAAMPVFRAEEARTIGRWRGPVSVWLLDRVET